MWFSLASARFRQRRLAPSHVKAGRRHFAQKEYESALREFSIAIHSAPEMADAYCGRGLVYHELGQDAQAMSDLDRAIACDPRHASAYLERGKRRLDGGDLDGALADFGQLMLLRTNDPDTFLHRGVCLVKKGLLGEAAADFRRVLKLTNHTDYAEPAKNFIRQIEEQAGIGPHSASNGSP